MKEEKKTGKKNKKPGKRATAAGSGEQPPPQQMNYGYNYPPGGYPPQYYYPLQFQSAPKNHPNAIAALVLGIISAVAWMIMGMIGGLIGIPCGIIAIIMWKKAVREISAEPQVYTGDGMAKIGGILGIVGISISGLFLLVFAAIIVFYIVILLFLPVYA